MEIYDRDSRPGKPGPKRTQAQREMSKVLIGKLYLQGHPQPYICAEVERQFGVHISPPQISYDIASIVKEWRKRAESDIGEVKGIELGKLNTLELEYWAAWVRSCQPREITMTAKSEGGQSTISASSRREQRDGNPAFLAGVLNCIERRCKILGIDAPVKVNIEDVTREMARELGLDESLEKRALTEVSRILRSGR